MTAFNPIEWIGAGLDSFQTRIDVDGKLMPRPQKRQTCLCCNQKIVRSAYIFNPLTREAMHIGECCYARFVNNVTKKRCIKCYEPHQCKTKLCKLCRGPKISVGLHQNSYLSEIAEEDPEYFDWMFRCFVDEDVRAWFDRNKNMVEKIRKQLYHDGTVFKFGKYKDKTVSFVLRYDPGYFVWFKTNVCRRDDSISIHCWIELNQARLASALKNIQAR